MFLPTMEHDISLGPLNHFSLIFLLLLFFLLLFCLLFIIFLFLSLPTSTSSTLIHFRNDNGNKLELTPEVCSLASFNFRQKRCTCCRESSRLAFHGSQHSSKGMHFRDWKISHCFHLHRTHTFAGHKFMPVHFREP